MSTLRPQKPSCSCFYRVIQSGDRREHREMYLLSLDLFGKLVLIPFNSHPFTFRLLLVGKRFEDVL
jgi:hypothetical protein